MWFSSDACFSLSTPSATMPMPSVRDSVMSEVEKQGLAKAKIQIEFKREG